MEIYKASISTNSNSGVRLRCVQNSLAEAHEKLKRCTDSQEYYSGSTKSPFIFGATLDKHLIDHEESLLKRLQRSKEAYLWMMSYWGGGGGSSLEENKHL